MTPEDSAESLESSQTQFDAGKLESIRSILLSGDRERINALAAEMAAIEQRSITEKDELLQRIRTLQEELDHLQNLNRQGQATAEQLQKELDLVRQDMAADYENRVPFLVGSISSVIFQAAKESRASLARALSPVMGEAISNQIRNSQDEMVDALQPIILRTVQKAISEFARDLQRNIDARLKATLGPSGLTRLLGSRLRGVDNSDLVLRDSLPFMIDELFLIQRESGLLIDYVGIDLDSKREKELIGGMLTAIRDFTRDSFGDDTEVEELDEIQYGEDRIIIESGTSAYIAAAIRGTEPSGFRSKLRNFVVEQHLYFGEELRRYDGNPAAMPDFSARLGEFRGQFLDVAEAPPEPMSRSERWLLLAGGIGSILILALACFYLQFTIALLPVAFGETATPTSTQLPTATTAITETAIPTNTPTTTSTATPPPSPTPTTTPTYTATATPSPTSRPTETATIAPPTATPEPAKVIAPVWVRREPDLDSSAIFTIAADTEVTIIDQSGEWLEIEVITNEGLQQGWVPQQWVTIP